MQFTHSEKYNAKEGFSFNQSWEEPKSVKASFFKVG